MLGSFGVLAAGAIIYFTGWTPVDPIVAVLIGLWVLPRTWILLKDSLNILLEGVPPGFAMQDIEDEILATPGVVDLHDLHVWAVGSGKAVLTAHVVCDAAAPGPEAALLDMLRDRLRARFEIHHVTLQPERVACASTECSLTSQLSSAHEP